MSIVAAIRAYFAPLAFSARALREENLSVAEANRLQDQQVLRDELAAQWQLAKYATDPSEREAALDEIDRINTLLRAT